MKRILFGLLLLAASACSSGGRKLGDQIVPVGVIGAQSICDHDSGQCASIVNNALSTTATLSLGDAGITATVSPLVYVVDSGTIVEHLTNGIPVMVLDGGSVSVSNFPASQTVAGTLTCNAGTGTLNVAVQNGVDVLILDGGSVSVSNFPSTVTCLIGDAGGITGGGGGTGGAVYVVDAGAQPLQGIATPVSVLVVDAGIGNVNVLNQVVDLIGDAGPLTPLSTVGTTAASTAATAGQVGLVCSLSPNSPLPAGSNALGSVTIASGAVTVSDNCTAFQRAWSTGGSVNGVVAKDGGSSLCELLITNRAATTVYPCIQNLSVPDAGFPCQLPLPAIQSGFTNYDQTFFGQHGEFFDAGITICMSVEAGTCTPTALDAGSFDLVWGPK